MRWFKVIWGAVEWLGFDKWIRSAVTAAVLFGVFWIVTNPIAAVLVGLVVFVGMPWGLLGWERWQSSRGFDLSLGEAQVEFDDGARWVVRLPVVNNGKPGLFRAYLADTDGTPRPSSPIPLAWSNEDAGRIELSSVSQTVFCGFLELLTETTPSWTFRFIPTGPGFPFQHLHKPLSPTDFELWCRVRVGRTDIDHWEEADIFLWFDGDTPRCRSTAKL